MAGNSPPYHCIDCPATGVDLSPSVIVILNVEYVAIPGGDHRDIKQSTMADDDISCLEGQ
jgi:hypothetical protein